MGTVNAHTGARRASRSSLWVFFLVTGHDNSLLVGVVAPASSTGSPPLVGLLILLRWLPEPRQARLGHRRRPLVGGAGVVGARPCRHAGRRARVHLVLRHPQLRSADARASRALDDAAARSRPCSSLALLPAAARRCRGAAAAPRRAGPAVIGRRVIGHSVQGRPIVAWHLGEPRQDEGRADLADARQRAGAAPDPRRPARRARRCTASTCGSSRSTTPTGSPGTRRKNAHGVDLNRNYPYRWARPRPAATTPGPRPALRARDPGDDGVPARR